MQGYLGGVSWGILTAKIIQLNQEHLWGKNLSVAQLLLKFFKFYKKWDWKDPIQLCEPVVSEIGEKFHKDFNAWRPSDLGTKQAPLMPIITPASPA